MEILFLGTGTSQGVPMIASPAVAGGPDLDHPANWRTRASIHVTMGETQIQVDAAQEFRLQCIWHAVDQIDVFLLTHGHADHILGMDDLRRFCDLRGGGALPVYSTAQGLERIRQIYPYAIRQQAEFSGYPAFHLQEMPEILELPGGTIRHTLLPHGRVQVLGLIFEEHATGSKAVYYPDCARVDDHQRDLARGADLFILDALRPQPHPTHLSIQEAVEVARDVGAKQTWFTHMTYLVDAAKERQKLDPGIDFAWDGLRIRI